MTNHARIRIYIDNKISLHQDLILDEKSSHYLCNVMRCTVNDEVICFNSVNGEFITKIKKADKKNTVVSVIEKTALSENLKDLWLIFAPVKKDNTDIIITKAVELGVTKIIPVITEYTNSEKVRIERFLLQAKEASEQCGRLSIPQITNPIKLNDLLNNWEDNRTLFFLDERRSGNSAFEMFSQNNKSVAILVGPEGGFSSSEAQKINSCYFVKNVSLGPRILRAETAAITSLAVWQAISGDWKGN